MEPSATPQPPKDTSHTTPGNPVNRDPAEQQAARHRGHGDTTAVRIPDSQSSGLQDATPSSLAYGMRGAGPGEEATGRTAEQMGRHQELEGEQMRAPGEGNVADVVHRKPGAGGAQPDLASDLDR